LPNSDLPWATPINPITSSANSGVGWSPTNIVEGTWCVIIFADENEQVPMILGTIASQIDLNINKEPNNVFQPSVVPVPEDPQPSGVNDGSLDGRADFISQPPVTGESLYLGSMTKAVYDKWKNGIGIVESGGVYSKQNTLGYSGKYQFGVAALEDCGYVVKGSWSKYGTNKILLDLSEKYNHIWAGKDGVSSTRSWLGSGSAQEAAMDILVKRNYRSCIQRAWFPKDPTKVPANVLGGLLGVAHNQGPGGVNKLVNGQIITDGYGTSSSKYYWYGYNAAMTGTKDGTTRGPLPTPTSLLDGSLANTPTPPPVSSEAPLSATPVGSSRSPYIATTPSITKWAFADPNGLYPKKDMHLENDLHRLARGQYIDKTCVGEKEHVRTKNVTVANSGTMWHQSPIPYAAQYPYNHVYASEAGHIMEFDDTPTAERVHIHHRMGTFIEMDNYGNRTDKVMGQQTIIVEDDQLLNVRGSGHINVMGDMTIKVGGQCQIEVMGDANVVIHGNSYTKVDGEYNLDVTGNINMRSGREVNIQANTEISADAAMIYWNSGQSIAPKPAPGYTPVIAMPAPKNRTEGTVVAQEGLVDHTNPPDDIKESPAAIQQEQNIAAPPALSVAATDCQNIPKPYTSATKLSTNYTIGMLAGGVPTDKNNTITKEKIICNLHSLAINIIEPLRTKYMDRGFVINSCFRPGNSKSQHTEGEAVDIGFKPKAGKLSRKEYYDIAVEIANSSLPYDQILLEYRGTDQYWIHISHKSSGQQRRVVSTFVNDKNYPIGAYPSGLILVT
jgi:hypothetical protein